MLIRSAERDPARGVGVVCITIYVTMPARICIHVWADLYMRFYLAG